MVLIILLSCSGKEEVDQSFYYQKTNIDHQDYVRDSLLITHVSNEYFRIGLDGQYVNNKKEYYRFRRENDSSLIYRFVPIKTFYNDAGTKLYSYVIMAVSLSDTSKWPEEFDHFSAFNLMGFRESKCDVWKLYPYDMVHLFGAPTLDTIVRDLNNFYFENLKNYSSKFNHTSQGQFKKNDYNLDDSGFWDNYPDIVKGTSYVDSLYGFQFSQNNPNPDKFKEKGFECYIKNLDFEKYAKEANSKFKQNSIEWQLYLWRNKLQDTSVTYQQIRFKKDSLNLEIVRKYIYEYMTMQDVIEKGIDYYTYKPKIDSVRYPDSLLKMYECK